MSKHTPDLLVSLKEAREAFCGLAEWLLNRRGQQISAADRSRMFADCQRQRLALDEVIAKVEGRL